MPLGNVFRLNGEARGALARGRQTRREFIETVNAGDFFDETICVRLPHARWLRAFPRGKQRTFRAAILVIRTGAKPRALRLASTLSDVRAHNAKNFRASHTEFSAALS